MPFSVQQWDSYAVLDVDKTWTRCYGWAPTQKRQCANPVAMANIRKAQRLLTEISQCDPSSDEIPTTLNQIAHCLLCRRNHQDQAQSVVREWEDKLKEFIQTMTEGEEQGSDTASGEENTTNLQAQMAECQRLLTRVATALAEQQDAQRQFETSSAGTDTSTETIRDPSLHETEVPHSEDLQSEEGNEIESPSTGLNIGHVQSLVRQLESERETSRARRQRVVRFVDDDGPETAAATEASPTPSSQTLDPAEASPGPHALDSEQGGPTTASSTYASQTRTSEVEAEQNQLRQPPTAGRLDLFDFNEMSDTDVTLPSWLNIRWNNVWWDRQRLNQNLNLSCRSDPSQHARRHTYLVWLSCLFLYTGMVLICYWLQNLHVGRADFLALEGSGFRQIGA